jgi:fatty-acyl-CoA synthase
MEWKANMHCADLMTRRALLTPRREALLDLHTGVRYPYAQLNARANRLAHWLHERCGVGKGDRVSILAHNGVVYIDLLYAVAKIDAVLAPLNWRLVARELTYIAHDCRPKVLLCGPEFVEVLTEIRQEVAIEHCLALEGAVIEGAAAYEEALAGSSETEPKRPVLNAEDPYCLLYTSGTTGPPRAPSSPTGRSCGTASTRR